MSTTVKLLYGTSTAITITASTLASSATVGRESAAVDNGTNLFLDAMVGVQATANGTPTAGTFLWVYAAGSEDGTNYTDNATGSDAALTLKTITNLKLIGVLNWSATASYQVRGVFSVALAFGGILPRKWNIIIIQNSGVALSALAVSYTGVQAQNV